MAFFREKGLCYNCDNKWSSTHCCKGRVLLFIADTDPLPDHLEPSLPRPPSPDTQPIFDATPVSPPISLHALSNLPTLETFHLFGFI